MLRTNRFMLCKNVNWYSNYIHVIASALTVATEMNVVFLNACHGNVECHHQKHNFDQLLTLTVVKNVDNQQHWSWYGTILSPKSIDDNYSEPFRTFKKLLHIKQCNQNKLSPSNRWQCRNNWVHQIGDQNHRELESCLMTIHATVVHIHGSLKYGFLGY